MKALTKRSVKKLLPMRLENMTDLNPEHRLMVAIVARAISDARGTMAGGEWSHIRKYQCKSYRVQYACKEQIDARDWFAARSQAFFGWGHIIDALNLSSNIVNKIEAEALRVSESEIQ